MPILNIYIDSSTKRTKLGSHYGESVAAWGAWWDGIFNEKPIRCGIHYFRHEGPNKVFYEGVIRALEQCVSLMWVDKCIVRGDCELVIKQLRGEWRVGQMKKYFKQVQVLKIKYKGNISFEYISESDPIYKKIDQLAKRSRSHIIGILK